MRNQRGGVKLITLIGIVLTLTVILFALVVYDKISNKENNDENIVISENTFQDNIIIENIFEDNTIEENIVPEEQPVVDDTKEDDFSMKFLQLENNQKNMIYSPLSIKSALKMLQEGANGNTKAEIEKVIGNLNIPNYKNVGRKLSFANGIYIRDTFSKDVKQEFINSLVTKHNAEVKYDAFKDATNANKWIENKTLGIIKNMLKDDIVRNPDSRMLLINALAINMEWERSFDFKDTYGEEFYLANGEEMIATTMNMSTSLDSASYYIGEKVTALTMDLEKCEDTELEFMAIMPDSNLKQYVDNITMDKINEISNKLILASETKAGVEISIPKFKFSYDLKLKEDLIKLGIEEAFIKQLADFSKITGHKTLYVSNALHKADIDFSEKGIKAAAVTVFAMDNIASVMEEDKPKVVNIDKPFMFIIRDKNTKEIWFTGTVYEPNSWEDDKADYQSDYKGRY